MKKEGSFSLGFLKKRWLTIFISDSNEPLEKRQGLKKKKKRIIRKVKKKKRHYVTLPEKQKSRLDKFIKYNKFSNVENWKDNMTL